MNSVFSKAQNQLIDDAYIKNGEGWIAKSDVEDLQKTLNLSINELMLALLPIAQSKAIMPVVGYLVGAIGLGESGNLYFGACQDFGYGPINQTVHAEQAVIANAFSHGETGILKIACTDVPCGHCRQFLYELTTAQQLEIVLLNQNPMLLTDLLPHPFGPKELGQEAVLLKHEKHAIELPKDLQTNSRILKAFEAAQFCYAPYTQAYAGVAIEMKNKKIYTGKYIETVAHNPSLPPMQAALVNLTIAGEQYADIVSATLVHRVSHFIDQAESSKITLNAVNRKIDLQMIAC